jgi:hypothetical protein
MFWWAMAAARAWVFLRSSPCIRRVTLARRQLTDGQRVLLGIAIEPDIAKVARRRQAHGQTAPGRSAANAAERPAVRTVDEVARTVGLGSGDTYERHRALLEEIEQEEDGQEFIDNIRSGAWDMDDVRGVS